MESRVVRIAAGEVAGLVEGDAAVFRGIPYAAPPFGENLWKLPQAVTPWDGVFDASEYGPICPQPTMDGGGMLGMEAEPQGEDCLRLNVWTPAAGGTNLPVMVWIHGGAYLFGSGSAPGNRGATFARDGVVFVSMNYRLGAIGFLHAGAVRPELTPGSGNYGIADQIAALEWVRDNIEAFGGDPGNVTIFGVSAGGNYVQSLTVCPPARGLFRRAIAESAGGTPLFGLPAHVASAVSELYFEQLGLGAPADVDLVSLTPEQLLAAQDGLLGEIRSGGHDARTGDLTVPFYPVAGTDHQPKSVVDAHADGDSADVDMIIGTNRHEMTLFKIMEQMAGTTASSPREYVPEDWNERVRAVYAETEPDAADERIAWTIDGDRGFRIPNLRSTEARVAGGGRTWAYEFAWESPVMDGRLGAAHGLEIPFVFDELDTPLAGFLLGGAAPAELAQTMHAAWIEFARTGKPAASPDLPTWPEFDLEQRPVAVFNTTTKVVTDPDRARREAWDGIDIGHAYPPA